MIAKSLVFVALLASTPIALVATQAPAPRHTTEPQDNRAERRIKSLHQQSAADLTKLQQQLDAARDELQQCKGQLDRALDALEQTFQPQRERNCSPSRSRALMTHYQWLRDEGHGERAAATLTKVVDQVGSDQHQRNATAWNLMTDKQTSGKFDDLAFAIAQRMEKEGTNDPHHLDTIALANFLVGQNERAIELQEKAIAAGGNGDEYRRRLRTYEAAQLSLVGRKNVPPEMAPVQIAAKDDE